MPGKQQAPEAGLPDPSRDEAERENPDASLERAKAQARECAEAHAESGYYQVAEPDMDDQWRDFIWPLIDGMDFRRIVELAPGHGRNTRKLMDLASRIELVDVNENCIDACRERFGAGNERCSVRYHVGSGLALDGVSDNSATFVYSWDSVVHFDREVVRRYVAEFERVLEPGGTGFIHHSNYGALCEEGAGDVWDQNPSWRSNVSAELFAGYCKEAGLEVLEQRLLWWFIDDLDCLTTFRKRA